MSLSAFVAIAKKQVREHMQVIPQGPIPADSDFEEWGRKFIQICVSRQPFGTRTMLLTSIKGAYKEAAGLAGIKDDVDINGWWKKARDTFDVFEQHEWLKWAGPELMPRVWKKVEVIKKAKKDAELRRVKAKEEKREEKACAAERKKRVEKGQHQLLQQLMAKQIDMAGVQRGLDILMSEVEAPDDGEGEAREAQVRGTKRKEWEGRNRGELRQVKGKCGRCRSMTQTQPLCKVEDDWSKCQKCVNDKQGCYWDGISRSGVRRRSDPEDGKQSAGLLEFFAPHVKTAAGSSQSPRDKGKGKAAECEASAKLKAMKEELAKVRGRIAMLFEVADNLERGIGEAE